MSRSMMAAGHGPPRRGFTRADILVRLALLGIAVVCTVLAMWSLWLAGGICGLLSARGWPASGPQDSPGIAVRLTGHLGDPAQAWPAQARGAVPGPLGVYPLWLLLFVLHLTGLVGAAVRPLRRTVRRRGFARRGDVDRLLSASAVLGRVDVLRPGLTISDHDDADRRAAKVRRRADPLEMGRPLGHDALSGRQLYLPNEYSELGIGVARFAGKTTRYIIPRVVDARGAVISTSTRLDVADVTFELRSTLGPTLIFEPQGELLGVPRLRFSPIDGCDDPVVAMLRAAGFAAGSDIGKLNDGKWFQDQAAAIIRGLLHAAALDGLATMTDVVSWAETPSDSRPERILRAHGMDLWADRLARHRENTGRTRDTIQSVVSGALDAFHDPRVLAACSPPSGQQFKVQQWLAEGGTLYLVGTRDAQALVAPLFAAFVEDIVYRATRAALTTPGGRVEPCLYFIGDEITNVAPIPSLPSLMSVGGGSGIALSVACQNRHQLLERWGKEGGQALADNANAHIMFGGSPDVAALRDVQALAGKAEEVTASAQWGGGRASVQESARREDLIDLADLRTMGDGHALVLVGNLAPVEVRMPAWWQRPDAGELRAAQQTWRRRLAKAA